MRRNLTALNGLVMSERVTSELSKRMDRGEAITIVSEACRRALDKDGDLSDILKADNRITKVFSANEIDEFMSPDSYLGTSTSSK